MKIRYEKEIEDCSECGLYGTLSDCDYRYACEIDSKYAEFDGTQDRHPCELRPCPIEVKDKKTFTKTCANCNRVPCMKRMDMLNKGIDSDSVTLSCWEK